MKKKPKAKRKKPKLQMAIVRVTAQEQLAPTGSSAVATIRETVGNLQRVRGFIARAMNVDLKRKLAKLGPGQELKKWEREKLEVDWGTIPGVGKPFLKQPGAEKFMFWTQLRPKFATRENELPGGHLEVVNRVMLIHKKTKEDVFEGPECSCSTMESNYRYRWISRKGDTSEPYPSKDEANNLKAQGIGKWKKEWVGQGADRAEVWVWQDRYDNPNIHDERNKVRQMSAKRGVVKCVRGAGAMSEIFTEDPGEWDLPADPDAIDVTPVYDPQPAGRVEREKPSAGASVSSGAGTPAEKRPTPPPSSGAGQSAVAPTAAAAAGRGPTVGTPPAAPKKKNVTVSWTQDQSEAIVTGDLAELLDHLKLAKSEWIKAVGGYVMAASMVPEFWAYVEKLEGYQIQELAPLQPPPPRPKAEAAPAVAVAVIQKVTSVKDGAKKHVKYIEVLWAGNVWHTCFKRDLFDHLGQGIGKEAELEVEPGKPPKIVGIKRIGSQEFDGNVPAVSVHREAGGKTLFG